MHDSKPEMTHKQQPINGQSSGLKVSKRTPLHKNWLLIIGCAIAAIIVIIIISSVIWFQVQLSPAGSDASKYIKITIARDSTSSQISKQLQDKKIIRNAMVFEVYVRLSGKGSKLESWNL